MVYGKTYRFERQVDWDPKTQQVLAVVFPVLFLILWGLFWLSATTGFIAMAFFGATLMTAGLVVWFRTRAFVQRSVRVQGTVVRLEADSTSKSKMLHPVCEFTDTSGLRHEFRAPISGSPPTHKVGQAVFIRYPRLNPADARLDSFLGLWITSTTLVAIGAIFLVSSTIVLQHLTPPGAHPAGPASGTSPRSLKR